MNDIKEFHDSVLSNFEGRENIFLIQVGSNDGSDNNFMEDPVRDLIEDDGRFFSVLIEPQKNEFGRLKDNYSNQKDRIDFLNVAISHVDGPVKLYKNMDHEGTSGHSTLLLRQNDQNTLFDENHYELVDGITVSTLMKPYENSVDILVIDTEGFDMEIVKQFIGEKIHPKIIYFERPHPNPNDDRLNTVKCGYDELNNLLNDLTSLGYNSKILSGNVLCIKLNE
jgi:FkbM family methyltransferase